MAASASHTVVEDFREFCRRYSRAQRMQDNARSVDRDSERMDAAISAKQAIEAEFEKCFLRARHPDWAAVEAAALGELAR